MATPTIGQVVSCKCWVSTMDDSFIFGARWGAHDLDCVLYRPSRDPVDRLEDDGHRNGYYAAKAAKGMRHTS